MVSMNFKITSTPLYRHWPFLALCLATFVSILGDAVLIQALAFQVSRASDHGIIPIEMIKVTHSSFYLFEFIPFLLLAPFAGWMSDKFNQRKILIVSDLCRCVGVLFLINMSYSSVDIDLFPWVMLLLGVFTCFFTPAKIALLVRLVSQSQHMASNALLSSMAVLANAVGAIIAGDFIFGGALSNAVQHYMATDDPQQTVFSIAIVLDSFTFLLSACILCLFKRAESNTTTTVQQYVKHSALKGFTEIFSSKNLCWVISSCFVFWAAASMVKTNIYEYAKELYNTQDISKELLTQKASVLQGHVLAIIGVGVLLGVGVIAVVGKWLDFRLSISLSTCGLCLSFYCFLNSSLEGGMDLSAIFLGFFSGTLVGRNDADAVAFSKPEFLGRVLAAKAVVFALAMIATNLCVICLSQYIQNNAVMASHLLEVVFYILLIFSCVFVYVLKRNISFKEILFQLFYAGTRFMVFCFVKLFYNITVTGQDNVPKNTNYIVVANHASYLDPLFVQSSLDAQIHFLTWDKITNSHPLLFSLLRAIPISDESSNFSAMNRSKRVLRRGGVLGIFPEGSLGSGEDELQKFHEGASVLSLATQVPLLPVTLVGHHESYPKGGRISFFKNILIEIKPLIHPVVAEVGNKPQQLTKKIHNSIEHSQNKLKKKLNSLNF